MPNSPWGTEDVAAEAMASLEITFNLIIISFFAFNDGHYSWVQSCATI